MISTTDCTTMRKRYEAARYDIEHNRSETLRILMQQTDRLLKEHTDWSPCQRAARMKAVLQGYETEVGMAAPPIVTPAPLPQTFELPERRTSAKAAGRTAPALPAVKLMRLPDLPGPDDQLPDGQSPSEPADLPQIGADVPVDLVVPLGTGSRLDDFELRICLRSFFTNVRNAGRAHIYGPRRPKWLLPHPRVVFHQVEPVSPKNHDIVSKFLKAARNPVISEFFVGSCDDFYILQPTVFGVDYGAPKPSELPRVDSPTTHGSYWEKAKQQTCQVLQSAGRPTANYDMHVPTLMSRKGWLSVDREVAWRSVKGHAVWSLYHNVAGSHGPLGGTWAAWHSTRPNHAPKSVDDALARMKGRRFCCANDHGHNRHLQLALMQLFPEAGPWEADAAGLAASFGTVSKERPAASPALGTALPRAAEPTAVGTDGPPAERQDFLPVSRSSETVVVTVLRSGGRYGAYHVEWLKRQLDRHFKTPHTLYCLTDRDLVLDGVRTIRLSGRAKGWFAKLELFDSRQFPDAARVLYLDLDTVIQRDFALRPLRPGTLYVWDMRKGGLYAKYGTSGMAWVNGSCNGIRTELAKMTHVLPYMPSDQEVIMSACGTAGLRMLPLPFEHESLRGGKASPRPPKSALVGWCGREKPWDVQHDWIPCADRLEHTALIWAQFGCDGKRQAAAEQGILKMLKLRPRPFMLLAEAVNPGSLPVWREFCGQHGIQWIGADVPELGVGLWHKEALFQLATDWLETNRPAIKVGIFADADVSPEHPDWAAVVESEHLHCGLEVMQPWRRTRDTVKGSGIGGEAMCCRAESGLKGHPGYCWSVDLGALRARGGWRVGMFLGAGDTLNGYLWTTGRTKKGSSWGGSVTRHFGKLAQLPMKAGWLGIDLVHENHGDAAERQYTIRYAAFDQTGLSPTIVRPGPPGCLVVEDSIKGRALLRYIARRKEWSGDLADCRRIWRECCDATSGPDAAVVPSVDGGVSSADEGVSDPHSCAENGSAPMDDQQER